MSRYEQNTMMMVMAICLLCGFIVGVLATLVVA